MRRFLKWLIFILILAILGTGGYFGQKFYQEEQELSAIANLKTTPLQRGSIVITTTASGTIRSNQTVNVTWQASGIVGDVKVKLGQNVEINQIMATLNAAYLPPGILQAQVDLMTAQKSLDDYLDKFGVQKAQAMEKYIKSRDAYVQARNKRARLDWSRATPDMIEEAKNDLQYARDVQARAEELAETASKLTENDLKRIAAEDRLEAAKLSTIQAESDFLWFQGKPSQRDYDLADAQVNVTRLLMQDARREVTRLEGGAATDELTNLKQNVQAATKAIQQAYLIAPISGTVTDVRILPRDLTSTTSAVVRIDDLSVLYADLQFSESDVNRIKVGQSVQVVLDAVLKKTYRGELTQIGVVAVNNQGTIYFPVTVRILDPDESMKPGMSVAATVVSDQVDDALLIPNRASRIINNNRMALVMKDGKPVPVTFQPGLSTDLITQISRGELKEGDRVVLNPPLKYFPSVQSGTTPGQRAPDNQQPGRTSGGTGN